MRWGAFGVGLIAAAWASGCDSAEREFSEPPPAPACDPGSNSTALGDDCAIFVAPTGDDASAGSKEKPLRTLGKAVLAAKGSGVGRVYACRGIYDEALVIPPGITLVGALDCYEGTWAPTDDKSVIAGAADKVAVRFLAGEKIVLDGFKVVAANASAPGGSSIAAIAAPEASVDIRRSEISAGDGAVGVDGEDGVPGLDAPPVDLLNEGQPLCSGTKGNPGGPPHMNSCGDDGELSIGGEGGFGGIDTGGDGSSGEPVSPGTGEGGVTGAACFKVGGSGHAGAAGADGAPGAPGAGLGLLTVAEGWVGVTGGAKRKARVRRGERRLGGIRRLRRSRREGGHFGWLERRAREHPCDRDARGCRAEERKRRGRRSGRERSGRRARGAGRGGRLEQSRYDAPPRVRRREGR